MVPPHCNWQVGAVEELNRPEAQAELVVLLADDGGLGTLVVATAMTAWAVVKCRAFWDGRIKVPGAERAAREQTGLGIPPIQLMLARVWIAGLPIAILMIAFLWLEESQEHLAALRTPGWELFEARLKSILGPGLGAGGTIVLFVAWTGLPSWIVAPPYRRKARRR